MPKPLHAGRHATALKIAAALRRAEGLAKRANNAAISAALKELHDVLGDAVLEHGDEIGIGGDLAPFSGGLAK